MHFRDNSKTVTSVVHGMAIAFWTFCILWSVLGGLCFVIYSLPAHGSPIAWSVGLIRVSQWPAFLQVLFAVGVLSAIVDVIRKVARRKKQ